MSASISAATWLSAGALIDVIGFVAAITTTLCWLPQAVKIVREKQTQGISLVSQSAFTAGVALWLAYGLLAGSLPVIAANAATLALSLAILVLKLRYG